MRPGAKHHDEEVNHKNSRQNIPKKWILDLVSEAKDFPPPAQNRGSAKTPP